MYEQLVLNYNGDLATEYIINNGTIITCKYDGEINDVKYYTPYYEQPINNQTTNNKYTEYYRYNHDLFGTYNCRYIVRLSKLGNSLSEIDITSVEPRIEDINCKIYLKNRLIHKDNNEPAVLIVNGNKILSEEFWCNGKRIKSKCNNPYFVKHFLNNMKLMLVENQIYEKLN